MRRKPPPRRLVRIEAGTFAHVIRAYQRSSDYTTLQPSTKRTYAGVLALAEQPETLGALWPATLGYPASRRCPGARSPSKGHVENITFTPRKGNATRRAWDCIDMAIAAAHVPRNRRANNPNLSGCNPMKSKAQTFY